MKKRLIASVTAFALFVSVLFCFNASVVFADDSGYCGASGSILSTGRNASYTYVEATKTLTISGTGDTKDYGDTVVNRPPWYDYKTEIENVVIEEGIVTLGTLSFSGCTALKSVTLPSTLTTISGGTLNYGAFRDCTALETITLPSNLATIEAMAFRGCTSLKSITFPDSLTTLGDSAFRECTNLETVRFGTGLTSTGTYAFSESGVRNIIFSDTITSIDAFSFYNTKVIEVEFPETVANIGMSSFADCYNLRSVTVNNPDTTFAGLSIAEENPFAGEVQHIIFYGHSGSTTESFVKKQVEENNHDYEFVSIDPCDHASTHEVITLQPTCTETGITTQVCDECGFVVSTTELPALDHSWELTETLDETEENGHIISGYICSRCSEEKQEVEHVAFVEGFYEYTNTATCTRPGIETYTCTFDGCGEVERNAVLTANHTVEEYTVITEPTCTQKGQEQGVCTVCGETVTRDIDATGHQNELTAEYDNTLEDGHTYKTYTCSVCKEETVEPTHVEWVEGCYTTTTITNPTCTINGLARDTCDICSQTRLVSIPANGEHVWYETTRTEPTCTAVGKIYYACENCNLTRSEDIPALGHDYVLVEESTVAPTCTTAGYNTYKCNTCGATEREVVNATGHTPDEQNYTVISEPDCLNDGQAKSVCTTCGEEYDIILDALGHNYEDVLVPIEDKPGHSLSTPTCTRCGDTQSSSTVHNEWIEGYYDTTVVTAGSCTVAQITLDTCSICGQTRTNTTPAPGHDYTYTGLNDSGRLSYYCEVCENVYTASPSVTLALWNVTYINTAPGDTALGYLFDFTNDGIINAKDYSYLVRINKTSTNE